MRKLIVGCGYLGRRAARAWLARGDQVAALTRSEENAARFRANGWEAIVGDVLHPESLARLSGAETVLYAVGFDRASGRTPAQVYVEGLRNVLDNLTGKTERFLYVSSTSVYGQCAGEWVDETSACEPVQANGQVCLTAEQLLRERFPSAVILRLGGLYGPGRLLSRVETLRSGAVLSGSSEAWLNLIHVDDAVSAVLAAEERGRPGETYLVCDDEPVRRADYYGRLAGLIGAPAPVFDEQQPARRGSGPLNKRCDNRKLRDGLGVKLAFPSSREGLPHALRTPDDVP